MWKKEPPLDMEPQPDGQFPIVVTDHSKDQEKIDKGPNRDRQQNQKPNQDQHEREGDQREAQHDHCALVAPDIKTVNAKRTKEKTEQEGHHFRFFATLKQQELRRVRHGRRRRLIRNNR